MLIDAFRSLRPLIVSLVPGQQKEFNKAKKMREELQAEVSATIEEFGPKMHEDFDEVRRQIFARMPSLTDQTC
jgi:glycerol-3-phosphate O-acyltransferase / dihydroxyacetone phosphate acyltransferase